MIRRLTLRNWRSYEDITLDFSRGTTFIVAPNGIGKSSLMEAAAWAIFGDLGPRDSAAVRLGNPSATATVELELPDLRVISISRTLPGKPGAWLPKPTISIDGVRVDEAEAVSELRGAYAADLAFLLRLVMPQGPIGSSDPAKFGLREHLCRIFGIDGLLTAATNLDQRLKVQEKLIRATRQATPADATAITALEFRVAQAEASAEAAEAELDRITAQLNKAHETQHARKQLLEWQHRSAEYSRELTRLAETTNIGIPLDVDDTHAVQAALDDALEATRAQLEDIRVQQATLIGRATFIGQHSQELQDVHGDCPVCHRPLDKDTIAHAKSAHTARLMEIDRDTEKLRAAERDVLAKQMHVRAVIERYRAITPLGPEPKPDIELDLGLHNALPVEEISAEQKRLLAQLVSIRNELDQARRALQAAHDDEAAHGLLRTLYSEEAAIRASRSAIFSATTDLLDTTIRPLTADLSARWSTLFPDRGQLRAQSNGDVTREINGESLPYSAFSTGERTGLSILLRLLVLESSTKADFCWFDEPLEHLDPDSRRHVAEILVRASSMGQLNQIVVSTYEEPLARRLQERDPDNVKLIYVRQGTN